MLERILQFRQFHNSLGNCTLPYRPGLGNYVCWLYTYSYAVQLCLGNCAIPLEPTKLEVKLVRSG